MTAKINNNILLISSDNDLNELLQNYCLKFDYNLSVFDSGSKGIQAARESTVFPVIIITQLLFDITGSKAISILKKQAINSKYILVTESINHTERATFIRDGADVIHSNPLNISEILLDIQDGITSYKDVEEKNVSVLKSPRISMVAEFHFTIRDISETGCLFRSQFPIEPGSVIILESKEISDKLSVATNTIYPIRVMNCKHTENNKGYDLGGIFVGMQQKISSRLRHACLSAKGFKFTTTH